MNPQNPSRPFHIGWPIISTKALNYAAILLVVFSAISCSSPRNNDAYRLLKDVDSLIETDSDSALAMLDGIDPDEFAAAFKKSSEERFLAHLYCGIHFINNGDYDAAMSELSRAEDHYEHAAVKDQALLHKAKGFVHKVHYDYDSTISEGLLSAERFLEAGDMREYLSMIINIMDCHIMKSDIDAALEYSAIAGNYLEHGKSKDIHDYYTAKAKVISQKLGHEACAEMLDDYLENMEDESGEVRWRILAWLYNNAGRHEKALECIEKEAMYNDVSDDQSYYIVLADVRMSLKDYKGASEAYKTAMHLGDTSTGIMLGDAKFIEERHKNELNQLKAKSERNSIILICVIALLFSRIVVWKTRRRLEERTAEKEMLEKEKKRYEKMYSEVVTERDALTKMVEDSSVNESTKEIIERRLSLLNKVIVSYITDTSSANRKANDELEALVSDRDSFITSTRMTLESSHPSFFRYLREKGLTDWEINYCCLYLIGLKGKDIGEYINLKRHYTYGSVIRQKLGLTENDTNLSLYLKKLVENQQA